MAEATVVDVGLKEHIQAAIKIILDEMDISSVQPLGDRVLVKPMEKEFVQKTASGRLFVVEGDDKRARMHLVLGVGKVAAEDHDLKVGDIVVAGRYVGHPIEWRRENYRLIAGQDILGTLNTDD